MFDWQQPEDFDHDPIGYATPEEAIAGDIPSRYWTRLFVDVDPSGRYAAVVLGLNDPPFVEFEEGFCDRWKGNWYPQGDMYWYPPIGLFSWMNPAPPGAIGARIRFQGKEHDCEVNHGFVRFVTWDLDEQRYEARGNELDMLHLKQARSEMVNGVPMIQTHPELLGGEDAALWIETSSDRFPEVVEFFYG